MVKDDYTIYELLNGGMEPINDHDMVVANYVINLLPTGLAKVNYINPTRDFGETFRRGTYSFLMYENEEIIKRVMRLSKKADHIQAGVNYPFVYMSKFITDEEAKLHPQITIPNLTDAISYVYLAHEYHHMLKDNNPEEHRYKYRFSEVITLFYELVEAHGMGSELLKREIYNRRLALLKLDLLGVTGNQAEYANRPDKGMKYYNSFYYSLCLFRLYKENPKKILGLVAKVLNHEMTTLELLYTLDLYDNGMDSVVKEEMDGIKKVLKNS